jgi:uncharacterized protein (TIGR03000 family)
VRPTSLTATHRLPGKSGAEESIMLRHRVSFALAATFAATAALLAPSTSSAQFFRPYYGGYYGGYPGFGYGYGMNPYPIGRFPIGTTFYPNPANYASPYYSPYNSSYYPPSTAYTNPAPTRPYQPSIVEYNTNGATPSDDKNKDKPASSSTDSDRPYNPKVVEYNTKPPSDDKSKDKPESSRASSSTPAGRRAGIKEYNIPPEAMTPAQKEQPAKIDVEVPAGAEVYCDGTKTTLTGGVRKFVTPTLTPGSEYYYEFRAEWKEGDRTVTNSKRVRFHAGDHITVSFLDKPAATGDLPEPKPSPR